MVSDLTERAAQVILEIIWDDEKDDHPMQWDWEFLIDPGKLISARIIDPEGEGWLHDSNS